jgi:type I restriction enzyme, R subunit
LRRISRRARAGEETGLSDEEIAFDALAENKSAQDVMGEPILRVIAHELVTSFRSSITVDWMHRDALGRACGCS